MKSTNQSSTLGNAVTIDDNLTESGDDVIQSSSDLSSDSSLTSATHWRSHNLVINLEKNLNCDNMQNSATATSGSVSTSSPPQAKVITGQGAPVLHSVTATAVNKVCPVNVATTSAATTSSSLPLSLSSSSSSLNYSVSSACDLPPPLPPKQKLGKISQRSHHKPLERTGLLLEKTSIAPKRRATMDGENASNGLTESSSLSNQLSSNNGLDKSQRSLNSVNNEEDDESPPPTPPIRLRNQKRNNQQSQQTQDEQ